MISKKTTTTFFLNLLYSLQLKALTLKPSQHLTFILFIVFLTNNDIIIELNAQILEIGLLVEINLDKFQ